MKHRFLLLLVVVSIYSCHQPIENIRSTIDLTGNWQFSLDTADIGINQKWYLSDLPDTIKLPGTTDLNQKGFINKDTTTLHLNRLYTYEGPAWYRRKINIPNNFQNKKINLILERTKSSSVWVDSIFVGKSQLLQSSQTFDLSEHLSPGEHVITIRVDNRLELTPYGNVHIYSDDTQTNWNGIIGEIILEASSKTFISNLQIFPDVEKQKADVIIAINNRSRLEKIEIELQVHITTNGKTRQLKTLMLEVPCDSIISIEYLLGNEMQLWDDYQQPLYKLTVLIKDGDIIDSKTASFGMREFTSSGTQFNINGRTTFLRGKHDACVFPLTGHPPMDVEDWVRLFKIARSYGINHYRFHSYCPPEAAFTAADRVGIFIQAELPFWGGLESDSVAEMLKTEGLAMLKSYANHPSFVMFSHGNEIWSGHDRVEQNIIAFSCYDNRPIYTMGANNNIGYVAPRDCSDFFLAARTPYAHDTILTHTRLTQSFADSNNGGILNTQQPSTQVNFDYAVSHIKVPIISHEIGQYQIYPDFKEIEKYTGVVKAWNLQVFRNRLEKSGMLNQNTDFQKASGAWSALCYKAEMESALRTKGFAGFQLLDLQDFPGQGTALVGILDAFMDSKQVISNEEWLQSCNDVVALLVFDKYCWTNSETFSATVKIANYSNLNITDNLSWSVADQSGTIIEKGAFEGTNIPMGGLYTLGEIQVPLSSQKASQKLTISLSINNTEYNNSYPIWVYPTKESLESSDEIIITSILSDNIINQLKAGKKVFLMPDAASVQNNSIDGLFPPDFWNYGMFKGISEWTNMPVSPGTLGILTNPEHPVFNSFPTESHTNWQWFSIIKASNPLILNCTDKTYRPIIQVIDNMERNNKLGLIFEFKVGEGKLLVCMSELKKIKEQPEAAQLYNSIINYMESDKFNPLTTIDENLLKKILN